MLALSFCILPLVLTRHARSITTVAAVPFVSTGLKNLGNTCYLNAQLQCAFHIPLVRNRVSWSPPFEELTDDSDEASSEDSVTNQDVTEDSPPDEQPAESVASQQPPKAEKAESVALLALREVFEDMARCATQKSSIPAAPRSLCLRLGINVMEQQDSQEFWKLLLPALERESISDLYTGSFEDYIQALDGSGRERRREEVFLDLSLDITSK